MSNIKNSIVIFGALLVLVGCGGGAGDNPDTSQASLSPIELIAISQIGGMVPYAFNTSAPNFYNSGLGYENGIVTNMKGLQKYDKTRSYRWNIERDGLIPIVFNTAHRDLYEKAMDDIESNVGVKLFSRGVLPDGSVSVGSLITNQNPVVLLTDSPSMIACGSSSDEWMDQTFSINPQKHPDFWSKSTFQPIYYVVGAISFENPACNMYNTTHHVLAQILGLRNRFYGFGDSNENPVMYMNLLKILYRNPAGTPFMDLK